MRRQIFFGLLLLGVLNSGFGQGVTQIKGSITYVSRDAAFMDLGKKAGVQVGDSVEVYRKSELLGHATVSQSSGSSSALQAVDSTLIAWQIGDAVTVMIQAPEITAQIPVTDTTLTATATTPTVSLDSTAFMPLKSAGAKSTGPRSGPILSGYLSARVDARGGNGDIPASQNMALYGQLKVSDLGIKHLDASAYIRGSESFSGTGFDAQLYSIMLQYADPSSPLQYYLGRMYHPQFSMLGTVDGLGVSWRSAGRSLAMLVGSETPIPGASSIQSRQKFGLMDEEYFSWGSVQVGSVTELSNSNIARTYLLTGSTFKPTKAIRLRGYAELDLDPQNNSVNQGAISLTRFRTSLNWRSPWHISTNLRYSYRENVVDLLDTARTEFDLAARHALNFGLNWSASPFMTLSSQISYRTDGSGRDIQVYGLTMNHRKLGRRHLALNAGTMVMLSYLTQGGRIYASVGHSLAPWLDMDIYDEIYAYSILGDKTIRLRHLPELSFSAKVKGLNRIRLRTRLEQEGGDIYYRASLTASKQF